MHRLNLIDKMNDFTILSHSSTMGTPFPHVALEMTPAADLLYANKLPLRMSSVFTEVLSSSI